MIYNYMVNPDQTVKGDKNDKSASNADLDYLAWLTLMAMEARDATDRTPPSRPVQPLYTPPPVQPQYVPPPVSIEVTPGLPNPNTNRIYQLQVGAFSSDGALRVAQQLRALGFGASMEHIGNNIYRVSVIGIPAQYVSSAIQRLGAFGFRQIWVRE
jgi:cell division protein FtsN